MVDKGRKERGAPMLLGELEGGSRLLDEVTIRVQQSEGLGLKEEENFIKSLSKKRRILPLIPWLRKW